MKICRICEQFPPAKGGLSPGMLDLSLAQHERGHDVTVITRSSNGDSKFDSKMPFKVIRIQSMRIFDFSWKAYNTIKGLSSKPDVVHAHGPVAFFYLMRRNRFDPPLVFTMHVVRKYEYSLFQDLPEMVRNFEKRMGWRVINKPRFYGKLSFLVWKEYFLEKYICKRADHLVVVAKYFIEQVHRY
ncbi:MAG: glycosyltransferase family 4 protein, partial [Candidatus Hodarchaeota archaeon]